MMTALAEVGKNTRNAMEKMRKYLLTLLVFVSCIFAQAQNNVFIKVDEQINTDLRIKLASVDTNNISGYRIQIFSGNELSLANQAKSQALHNFPELQSRVYEIYQRPNWKIRVSDFYREIDAQKLLRELRIYFPEAFVVNDKIKLPPL